MLEVLTCNDDPCERNYIRIMQMRAPVIIVITESYVPVTNI